MSSIKKNYILNLINTITGMLFPLITFPYISRIMGPDGMGHVNFYSSIITYINIVTCLGIPLYAVREIGKVRDDTKELNRTLLEILILHFILSFLGYFVVFILSVCVPEINSDYPLFLILSMTIIFTVIGCDWFYQGMEKFMYITIRGIIVKILSIVFLFVFVKEKSDMYLYGVYSVIGVLGGNVFNFFRLRKFIDINVIANVFELKKMCPFRHLRNVLQIFILTFVSTVYLNLNVVFLGFLKNATAVGYYTSALKIISVVKSIIASLTIVMIPRMSNLASKALNEFHVFAEKSYNFVIFLALPLTVGVFVVSPYLVNILCGTAFVPAIQTTRILSMVVLINSLTDVIGMQILYPLGKNRILIECSILGCIIDIVLIYCFVPLLDQDGAAIAYVGTFIGIAIIILLRAKSYLKFSYLNKQIIKQIIAVIIMFVAIYYCRQLQITAIPYVLFTSILGFVTYIIPLVALRDNIATPFFKKEINRIKKYF